MSIYKRKNVYWLDITTPGGERIRRSTGTEIKVKALELHDKIKAELWDIHNLGKKVDRLLTEALVLFLEEGKNGKDFDTKKRHAKYWRSVFPNRTLSSLTSDEILNHLPTHNSKKKLLSSTQNRYRTSIMHALSLAYKRGWIDKVPYVPKKAEPKVRVRWITQQQASLLINNLHLEWMRDVCSFALLTGARMREILSLTWDKIDFARNIAIVTNDLAKSGKARSLPLSDQAMQLLLLRKRQAMKHQDFFSSLYRQNDWAY